MQKAARGVFRRPSCDRKGNDTAMCDRSWRAYSARLLSRPMIFFQCARAVVARASLLVLYKPLSTACRLYFSFSFFSEIKRCTNLDEHFPSSTFIPFILIL